MPTLTTTRSTELHDYARTITPGGVHSNVRLAGPSVFFERGEGAWLYDVDGNAYVDYLLGQGPNFHGHAPAQINDAVAAAARRGSVFGAQHVLENQAGELFLDTVGWAERVRFGLTGTETDQAALRLARAATGRTRFVRFKGTYHGWLDNMLVATVDGHTRPASAGQLASHLEDTDFIPYNDFAAVENALAHGDDVAAVILEPVMCNAGVIPPRDGFLQHVRQLCDRHGVVLIFDEVITGFRLALGGAAEHFGVIPDLAVYGKAMAGGWPVAALAGKASLMEMLAADVNHSGTFNSSIPACAAVFASLTTLREDPPYGQVNAFGMKLMESILELGAKHDLPIRVQGLPMAFHVSFGDHEPIHDHDDLGRLDLARYANFTRTLVKHGVWVAARGIWYVSTAHADHELTATRERLDEALAVEASSLAEAQAPIGPEVVAMAIARVVGPVVVGRDPTDVAVLFSEMVGTSKVRGQAGGYQMDAIAGIDTALWDIYGKIVGLPVSSLLGGRHRESLPCYASGLRASSAPERIEEAWAYVETGVGVKPFLGNGAETDAREMADLRAAVGDAAALFADALWAYSPHEAITLGRVLQENGFGFFEAPVDVDDVAGHSWLGARLDIPIGVGEALRSNAEFVRWLNADALGVCQPDLMRNGVTETARVAALADTFNTPVALHVGASTVVGMAATWQVAASLPNFLVQEHQPVMFATFNRWLNDPLKLVDGQLLVPSGPGLGIDVDEDAVMRDVDATYTVRADAESTT